MAMNSIDQLTMLPRTVEAAQIQGREQNQMQNAVDQPALMFQQKTQQEARKTVEMQKSDAEEYDMEDGGGGGGNAGARKRKKQKKDIREAPVAPRSDSSFDIMI